MLRSQKYESLDKGLKLTGSMKTYKSYSQKNKNVLFIIGSWTAKVESQEIHGIMGKFGLGLPWWLRW